VAFTLAHLLAMAKLRRRATVSITIVAAVLGAAMLYTHLAAVFIIGADFIVVLRELRRDGRSVSLPATMIALLLFAPFVPVAIAQSKALVFGHWLDWIGVHHCPAATRVFVAGLAAGGLWWLTFGARRISEQSEMVLLCLLYAALPPAALAVGSIVVRPMFSVRYAAPSFAVTTVMVAWILDRWGPRVRNEVAFGITILFAMLVPLTYAALDQPWREIAARVAASGDVQETIFFETGFFSPERTIDQAENDGFPQGFFGVPFKYYFKQPNPYGAVPGDDARRASQLIDSAVRKAGGAWLISGKTTQGAVAELPSGASFQTDFDQDFSRVRVLHVRFLGTTAKRTAGK
jgi:hypothetical protein